MSPGEADERPGRVQWLLPALASGLALAVAASLLVGTTGPGLPGDAATRWLVLLEIRLPRVALGVLVGAALGVSGAALQGFLRNPLAEPGLLGATGGATLGAVLTIHSGLAGTFALALPLGGLAGAGLAVAAVLALVGPMGTASTLILAGVAVSALAGVLTALVMSLSGNPFAAVEMVLWSMGSLADKSMHHLALAAPLMLLGAGLLLRLGPVLEALGLGEAVASSLGFDTARAQLHLVAGVAAAVGAATAVAGALGFVGLVVPHLLRPLVGAGPARLLPASLLAGALLVTLADAGLRLLDPGGSVRLGVCTSLLGAPLFLWLVMRQRQGEVGR
jgi:iron complex transport system permease protein